MTKNQPVWAQAKAQALVERLGFQYRGTTAVDLIAEALLDAAQRRSDPADEVQISAAQSWRVGSKVPLNVYEGDRPVCQCHDAKDAARIVAAVNQEKA